jgi:acyl dehydratase
MNDTPAADISFEELVEGMRAERRYVITDACRRALTDVFGDVSPIHVDPTYARRAGFEECVMHGAILNGFASHFVGIVLPGRRSLLLSLDMRYLAPSHLGDEIAVTGTVTQHVDSQRVVVLDVSMANATRARIVARGRAQVRIFDGL